MKTTYKLTSPLAFGFLLTLVVNTALAGTISPPTPPNGSTPPAPGGNKTHLNVKVKVLVNLDSLCIDNDNTTSNQFYYDGNTSAPFSIPKGFSFVITDIIVVPNCAGDFPAEGGNTLAFVENQAGNRNFTAQSSGRDTKHFALSGGIAFPFESIPIPRNTTLSSGSVRMQLLGYFVQGAALEPGQSIL